MHFSSLGGQGMHPEQASCSHHEKHRLDVEQPQALVAAARYSIWGMDSIYARRTICPAPKHI